MGPLLFLIFMYDIPSHPNTLLSRFADDTNTFSTRLSLRRARCNVQSHLNKIQIYFNKWKIKVNVKKSEAIVVSNKRKHKEVLEDITFENAVIPYKQKIRIWAII